jgi:hypothetical protein
MVGGARGHPGVHRPTERGVRDTSVRFSKDPKAAEGGWGARGHPGVRRPTERGVRGHVRQVSKDPKAAEGGWGARGHPGVRPPTERREVASSGYEKMEAPEGLVVRQTARPLLFGRSK